MEQHPIPQDITGFKFKLVGDMTLSQFGYLASGALLAYLSFASGLPFLIKWVLIILFGFSGFALAFLPVEERPLDRWIASFIRAIYSPTQYLWKKKGYLPSFFETSYLSPATTRQEVLTLINNDRVKLDAYLKSVPKSSSSLLDVAEQNYLQNLQHWGFGKVEVTQPAGPVPSNIFITPGAPLSEEPEEPGIEISDEEQARKNFAGFAIVKGRIIKKTAPKQPAPTFIPKRAEPEIKRGAAPVQTLNRLEYQNQLLNRLAVDLKDELTNLKQASGFTVDDLNKLKILAQRLTEVEGQRNQAEEEIARLKKLLSEQKIVGVRPMIEEIQLKETPRVRYVPEQKARHFGLPRTPQTPNILSGLITDNKGEILPGTIVIVKDSFDNPVRAMKTNKVGQFSISTPLTSGVYAIELEKEGYSFDIIEIEAKGEVIPPIQIKAK